MKDASADNWWLSSVNENNSDRFCNVDNSGSANRNNADNNRGVGPRFCELLRKEGVQLGCYYKTLQLYSQKDRLFLGPRIALKRIADDRARTLLAWSV